MHVPIPLTFPMHIFMPHLWIDPLVGVLWVNPRHTGPSNPPSFLGEQVSPRAKRTPKPSAKVLAASQSSELDKLGLADNTMVIFTSDNGYYLGEHKLGDKRSAYEEAMRVPMIVRFPKLAAKDKVIDTAVLNIDIAPTMLDFAGVAVPPQMQGRSWKPLLEGSVADWRRAFF